MQSYEITNIDIAILGFEEAAQQCNAAKGQRPSQELNRRRLKELTWHHMLSFIELYFKYNILCGPLIQLFSRFDLLKTFYCVISDSSCISLILYKVYVYVTCLICPLPIISHTIYLFEQIRFYFIAGKDGKCINKTGQMARTCLSPHPKHTHIHTHIPVAFSSSLVCLFIVSKLIHKCSFWIFKSTSQPETETFVHDHVCRTWAFLFTRALLAAPGRWWATKSAESWAQHNRRRQPQTEPRCRAWGVSTGGGEGGGGGGGGGGAAGKERAWLTKNETSPLGCSPPQLG